MIHDPPTLPGNALTHLLRRMTRESQLILEDLELVAVDPGMGLRLLDEISELCGTARCFEESAAEESLVYLF